MTEKSRRRRESSKTIILALAGVVVLAAAVFFLTRSPSSTAADTGTPDITLSYFDGTSEQLSELRGEPVILNFWASWCPACISEMPGFAEVHQRLGDRVKFIGMNMQEVDLDAANRLVEETGVKYQLAHDPNGAIYSAFGGIAMPTTVFIAADGSVARVHGGTLTAGDLTAIIENDLLQ